MVNSGHGVGDLLLEARSAADPTFAEYNPNEMLLHVELWAGPGVAGRREAVVVPGEHQATVAGLRTAVEAAFGLAGRRYWLVVTRPAERAVVVLDNSDQLLERECGVRCGDVVTLDTLPSPAEGELEVGTAATSGGGR